MSHIVAIHSYGSERVLDSTTQQKVSAHKIGASSVAKSVLLAVVASAREVTPPSARYGYVAFSEPVSYQSGYLLFEMDDSQLETVESFTRQHPTSASGVFAWRSFRWHRFPTRTHPDYVVPIEGQRPHFDPQYFPKTSLIPPPPSPQLQAKKSEREGQKACWWLTGNTYPHKDALRTAGCRWSKRRKSWYYVGDTLPKAVQALLPSPTESPNAPLITPQPLEKAFNVLVDEAEQTPIPQHQFTLNQTVYVAHTLRLTPTLTLNTNHKGHIVTRYQVVKGTRQRTDSYEGDIAYGVLFEGQSQAFPVFEENVSSDPQLGRIRRDERFALVPGMTSDHIMQLAIERRAKIPQERPILDALPQPDMPAQELPPDPEAHSASSIRVLKPELEPNDPLMSAIQNAKLAPMVPFTRPNVPKIMPIGQKFVGELTGSITGNVYCYGYAVQDEILLYINLGGPRMAVEAIRAKLSKGEIVNLVPWDEPAIELSAGETDGKANTGMYTAYLNSISEAKFTSAILVHECLTLPNYGGKSLTGIFRTSQEQAIAKLLNHVRQLVNIPVFEEWAGYLYQAGQQAGLMRKPRSGGDIDLLVLDLDASAWTRLITGGLANGVIQLSKSYS